MSLMHSEPPPRSMAACSSPIPPASIHPAPRPHGGPRQRPRRPRLGRGPPGLEPRRRPAPRRRRHPASGRRRRRASSSSPATHGLRVAAAGHRPQRRRARHARRHDPRQDREHARRRDRRRGAHRPRRRRRALGRRHRARLRARPRRRSPAPRPTSASSATSLGGGIGWLARKHGLAANSVTRDRARHRRRRARPRRRTTTTPTCSGRCAAAAATSASSPRSSSSSTESREVYAGVLIWPWERARRGAQRPGPSGPRTAPDEVTTVAPHAAAPAAAGHPRVPARPRVRGRSTAPTSATTASGAELLAPLRALGPEMDTFAPDGAGAALSLHPHGPGGARSPASATTRCSTSSTAEAIDALVATAGPGSGSPLLGGRAAPPRRRARAARRGPRRGRRMPRRVRAVRRRHADGRPSSAPRDRAALPDGDRRAGAVGQPAGAT